MKCDNCKEFLEIIDTAYEISNDSLSFFYKGKCPLCKEEFKWGEQYRLEFEGYFTLDEIERKGLI